VVPRVADRGVNHRLLVTGRDEPKQLGALVERLPDAGDVAVAEDAEAAAEETALQPVTLDDLRSEKTHECLCSRRAHL